MRSPSRIFLGRNYSTTGTTSFFKIYTKLW